MLETHERIALLALAKAEASLAAAEQLFSASLYDSSASRSYYACFQAASAALEEEGIRPRAGWTHAFVRSQFVGLLINRRHRFDADLRPVLEETRTIRRTADYAMGQPVTRRQADGSLRQARTMVRAVSERFDDR